MSTSSGIYRGTVVHTRITPRRHKLSYNVAALLLDLDALDTLASRLRLFSVNRANAVSFFHADHGAGQGERAADYARRLLAGAGLTGAGARVSLLCYPRMFGYAFNPISVYYCHNADDVLGAVIYEVNNTYRERTSYVVAAGAARDGVYAHGCPKAMSVSPFTATEGHYGFQIRAPGHDLLLGVRFSDSSGPVLKTHFRGQFQPLDDRNLLGLLLRYPAMTAKVIGAIHWEALKIYLKGVPLVRRRPGPPHSVSIPH